MHTRPETQRTVSNASIKYRNHEINPAATIDDERMVYFVFLFFFFFPFYRPKKEIEIEIELIRSRGDSLWILSIHSIQNPIWLKKNEISTAPFIRDVFIVIR